SAYRARVGERFRFGRYRIGWQRSGRCYGAAVVLGLGILQSGSVCGAGGGQFRKRGPEHDYGAGELGDGIVAFADDSASRAEEYGDSRGCSELFESREYFECGDGGEFVDVRLSNLGGRDANVERYDTVPVLRLCGG